MYDATLRGMCIPLDRGDDHATPGACPTCDTLDAVPTLTTHRAVLLCTSSRPATRSDVCAAARVTCTTLARRPMCGICPSRTRPIGRCVEYSPYRLVPLAVGQIAPLSRRQRRAPNVACGKRYRVSYCTHKGGGNGHILILQTHILSSFNIRSVHMFALDQCTRAIDILYIPYLLPLRCRNK
eukprot:1267908-Pyramimonas_sp.AAC.1